MRSRLRRYVELTARGFMLAALMAFVQQGAMIAASQAAAFAGSMPAPASSVHGKLHVHDALAGNMHMHGGNNAAGHVHQGPDHDDDGADAGKMLCWSLGATSAVLPACVACGLALEVAGAVPARARDAFESVRPDGLSRPPSTPSIA